MDILLVVQEESGQAHFDWAALWLVDEGLVVGLDSGVVVADDGLDDQVFQFLVDVQALGKEWLDVLLVEVVNLVAIVDLESLDLHLPGGDSSGLSNANVVDHGSGLHSLDVLDQDLVVLELVD